MTKETDPSKTLNHSNSFRSSNRGALEEIYRRVFPIVRQHFLKNSGTMDDAKDIFQEAMSITWVESNKGRFDEGQNHNLEGFIVQVAKHKWMDLPELHVRILLST